MIIEFPQVIKHNVLTRRCQNAPLENPHEASIYTIQNIPSPFSKLCDSLFVILIYRDGLLKLLEG